MSSFLQTIDSMKKHNIGDYVQFYNDKLGYIDRIIDDKVVRIREASENSARPRFFNVRSNLVSVVPISGAGSSPAENRNLIQPPSPPENEDVKRIANIGDETKTLINVLKKCRKWSSKDQTATHPFFDYLEEGFHLDKGWIKSRLPSDMTENKRFLTSKQRSIFVVTYNLLSGIPNRSGDMKKWNIYFNHAWNVNKQTTLRIIDSYYDSGFSPDRKIRKDKGHTLSNSSKKRKSVYTPLYVYKREQGRRRYRNHTHRLDQIELKNEFNDKSVDEQRVYKNLSDDFIRQGSSLHHNIIKALENTCGRVTYKQIANHLGGIVTENTVSKHLKLLDGFSIVKSRILPMLSRDAKIKRVIFCESFLFSGNQHNV